MHVPLPKGIYNDKLLAQAKSRSLHPHDMCSLLLLKREVSSGKYSEFPGKRHNKVVAGMLRHQKRGENFTPTA